MTIELFRRTFTVDRAALVRYAGASGDFNPIHWSERAAREAALPGVIAHGMLTMGLAAAALEDWAGDPGRITSLVTRFTRPVVVPDPGQVMLEVVGTSPSDDDAAARRVDLKVTVDGQAVLAGARATVKMDA